MAASFVIVVAGLRAGSQILLPFVLALFLAVLSMPLMFWLQLRRVPASLAIALTMLVIGVIFGALIMLGTQAVADLQTQIPGYTTRVQELYGQLVAFLSARSGFELDQYLNSIDPGIAVGFVGERLVDVVAFLGNTFMVLLIMWFILGEAMVFPFKFRAIVGPRDGERRRTTTAVTDDRRRVTKIVREVQAYLGIKTVVSLATGLLIGLLAQLLDLEFPVLLGLIGFVMNYVPTVGSAIAAVPALFLSLVQFTTFWNFMLVVIGYGVINMVFGNIIEPTLMGRRLGLSTLVVILSLLFWFFVWGPVGALLAVPLTMVVKIMLENTEDLRWVAILLDKSPPQVTATYATSSAAAQPLTSTPGGSAGGAIMGGGSMGGPDVSEYTGGTEAAEDATSDDDDAPTAAPTRADVEVG
jgi:predicted PurR-regulated permease PerM